MRERHNRSLDDLAPHLFEHQRSGAAHLSQRRRAYLGDLPGLGKTRTALAGAYLTGAAEIVVLCPAVAKSHWANEAIVLGLHQVRIISYDAAVRAPDRLPIVGPRTALILDEAHYLKHHTSQRTHLVLGTDGLARRAGWVYACSGTPVPRNPAEFGTILLSCFPEVAIKYGCVRLADVTAQFCVTKGRYVRGAWREKIVGAKNVETFRQLLGEILLRREPKDIGLDIPPLWFQPWVVDGAWRGPVPQMDPTGKVERLLATMAKGDSVGDLLSDPEVARYRRRVGEAKAPLVAAQLIDELTAGDEKVVVMAYHRDVLGYLRDAFAEAEFAPAYIDGDTTGPQRAAAQERFQLDPACRVFVGQITACQVSLTLTAARRVVLVEPAWAAYENYQAGCRVARIGQTRDHCVCQLVSLAGTLDDAVIRQHLRETQLVHSLFADSSDTPFDAVA